MLSTHSASNEAIPAVFGALPQNDPSLILTKHYKGITLREKLQVVDIKPECTTVRATEREFFPCLEGDIHVHSKSFPRSIAGRIHPIDCTQGIFLLSDLAYTHWKDRSFERVQPKDSVYLKFHHNGETYRAFLEDISVYGMGTMGNKNMDPFNTLRIGIKVDLEFCLNEIYRFSDLHGVLVYRQKVGLHLVKFGMQLHPTTPQKKSLERYITERKDEILEEVKQTYLRSREPQRVENLYF